ncbi:MAG: DUF4340 domain-containing protein [Ignavibacteria bacterium]
MKSSKTYLYLGILAVLLIAAYFLTSDRGDKTSSYELKEKKLFELDSSKVDKIEIKNLEGELVLSKSTGEWRATSPYEYNVNSAFVEKIVSSLKNMKIESIISTNPAKKDTYGFKDSEQAEISVYESGVLKGKFLLGGASAGQSSHIKKMDSDNIYIADNIERIDFIKPLNDWRDKGIVAIPKQAVNSIEYISDAESFIVKRDSTGKYSIGQDTVGKSFDGVLSLLEKFETTGFKDTTFSDQTKFSNVLNIDWGNKTTLMFLKSDTTSSKYFLKVSDGNQIFELDNVFAKNILKTKKEILTN